MVQTLDPAVSTPAQGRGQPQAAHPKWAFFKGEFVPIENAHLSIMTQVVN